MAKTTYQPKILRSMKEIQAEMGVGDDTVRRWAEEGAPIAVEGCGTKTRYSAEAAALQAWRAARNRRQGDNYGQD